MPKGTQGHSTSSSRALWLWAQAWGVAGGAFPASL